MALIESIPPFTHTFVEKTGWRGIPLDVLVVRGTFDLGTSPGSMRLSASQTPISWGDTYATPPAMDILGDVLDGIGDLSPGKSGTDIIVSGHVHSPASKPSRDWLCAVRIGALSKGLRVLGPRRFERTLLGWRPSLALPITNVLLDYRLAFGGRLGLAVGGLRCDMKFDANPAGLGWLPSDAEIDGLDASAKRTVHAWCRSQQSIPAPQFEDFLTPVLNPWSRALPAGLGPIARWWAPRVAYQGQLDAKWLAERYPLPPDNYDPRYMNSAHPNLISAVALKGDEELVLDGCFAEGKFSTCLPGIAVQAMTTFLNDHQSIIPLALDTVRIDLDKRQCILTWRTVYDRCNPPTEITITAMPVADWRRATEHSQKGVHQHA
jgi:hypothetical protein